MPDKEGLNIKFEQTMFFVLFCCVFKMSVLTARLRFGVLARAPGSGANDLLGWLTRLERIVDSSL
jgi:hypothetical protein